MNTKINLKKDIKAIGQRKSLKFQKYYHIKILF